MVDWHSLAKLSVHTESTLSELELLTSAIGFHLRKFTDLISQSVDAYETPGEVRKRLKRNAATSASTGGKGGKKSHTARIIKSFNLNTSKLHALGDYVQHLKQFGPAGLISTQAVSQT